MIKLALYGYGFYWLLKKAGYTITKPVPATVQGMGEHPLSCFCPHRHPELEKRIKALEQRP